MIYLITGQPGSGKTNYMVSQLLKNPDLQNRSIYVDGITDLDHDKINYFECSEEESPQNWHEWLPNGSILVIDECQRYFRPRSSYSNLPKSVQEFETHRHRGVDFFLITQHVRLLDQNVKSFVENHKHFSKSQLGTRRYFEWQRVGNPDSRVDVKTALVTPHNLDKSVYSLYKSAEEHTKIRVKRSKWIYILPIVLIIMIFSLYRSVIFVKNMDNLGNKQSELEQGKELEQNENAYNNEIESEKQSGLTLDDYIPTIDSQPWTAPIYNSLNTNVISMPYPVGCVKDSKKCFCYTEQATIISVSDTFCETHVSKGVFNPYYRKQNLDRNNEGSSYD